MAAIAAIWDFLSQIWAIFDLQVTPMLPTNTAILDFQSKQFKLF